MENNNLSDEVVIDIKQLFFTVLANIGVVMLVSVISAVLSFSYFNFVAEKKYNSTTQILVLNNKGELSSSDISVSTSLSNDYAALITTRPVLERVIAELNLNMGAGGLRSMIKTNILTNSRIISITVTDTSPIRAKRIADCLANASAERILAIMKSEYVNVVQDGDVPTSPSSPAVFRNTVIAFLLGFIITCAVIIIKEIVNDKIVTTDDVERYLQISVIGTIPKYDTGESETENGYAKAKKKSNKSGRKK